MAINRLKKRAIKNEPHLKVYDVRNRIKATGKIRHLKRTAVYREFKSETNELIGKVAGPDFLELCRLERVHKKREWDRIHSGSKSEAARKLNQRRRERRAKNKLLQQEIMKLEKLGTPRFKQSSDGTRYPSRIIYYYLNRSKILEQKNKGELSGKQD